MSGRVDHFEAARDGDDLAVDEGLNDLNRFGCLPTTRQPVGERADPQRAVARRFLTAADELDVVLVEVDRSARLARDMGRTPGVVGVRVGE